MNALGILAGLMCFAWLSIAAMRTPEVEVPVTAADEMQQLEIQHMQQGGDWGKALEAHAAENH